MSTVFITGATGFIAQHTIKELLDKKYIVIGTVRSASKGDKLLDLFNNSNFSYEIVSDLTKEETFNEIFNKHQEIRYILHTASPVNINEYDAAKIEEEVIAPAIEGTLTLLKAAHKKLPNIERFVFTSSVVAMAPFQYPFKMAGKVFNNESWNEITLEEAKQSSFGAYSLSKTWAEKDAWKFIAEEKPKFAFTTICPSYVFGPQLFGEYVAPHLNFSNELLNTLIDSKVGQNIEGLNVSKDFVAVQDVAKLHVLGFELESAKNERLVASGATYTDQLALNILNENFKELKGKIAVGNPDDAKVGKQIFDNSRTIKLTGIKFIGFEETLLDIAKQVVAYKEKNGLF